MSRIGEQPIKIEEGVKVEVIDSQVKVAGSLGELTQKIPATLNVKVEGDNVIVGRNNETKQAKSDHGTIRAIIANMIKGVKEGYSVEMEMVGVGYRASIEGNTLVMSLGLTHPVRFEVPAEVKLSVSDNVFIKFTGPDKQKVGLWAAKLRKMKKPEPYKGKGIKYVDEVVRRKSSKSAKEE